MKKTISILLILILSSHIFAQLSKGTFMPGMSINYNHIKQDRQDSAYGSYTNSTSKRNSISTNLVFGYFIKDNFAIGIFTGYQRETFNGNSTRINNNGNNTINYSNQIGNDFNIGLFSRYYKMISNSKFGFFVHANAQYQRGNTINKYINTSQSSSENFQKSNTFSAGISPGVVFFINDRMGIETRFGNIGYAVSNSKLYPINNSNGFSNTKNSGFDVNFSSSTLQLGVNFYIGRKTKN